MPTISLNPTSNTYIAQSYPTTNFKSSRSLYVGSYVRVDDIYRSLLKFETPVIPLGSAFVNAYLRLYLYRKDASGTQTIKIYIPTTGYNINTVTFDTQPSTLETDMSINIDNDALNKYIDIDVSDLVCSWISGGYPNYGIELVTTETQQSLVAFYSNNYSDSTQWPKLIINYGCAGAVTLAGRKFSEESYTHFTSDDLACTSGYNTSQQSMVTFFVKNTGSNPATVILEIGPNNSDYIYDGPETVIPPGVMKAFVPMVFGKYTRLCYKSTNVSNHTTLLVIYQAQV